MAGPQRDDKHEGMISEIENEEESVLQFGVEVVASLVAGIFELFQVTAI